jgi:hypothetical protein
MTDFRVLCAELTEALDTELDLFETRHSELLSRARAALAQSEPEFTAEEVEMIQAPWSLLSPPQSAPAAVPVAVSDALIKAECALADVAEGEPECDDGDPAQWSEQRCAETLAIIRPVMKLHKIRTSEWPPQPEPQGLTVQECDNMPKHGENYIYECRDGKEIQLDGYFTREDLMELAFTQPTSEEN